jgi:hypothetical protein
MHTVCGWQLSSAAICALRLADPAQQYHLRVAFPISWRVMAPGQLTYPALLLRFLRRSRFHLLAISVFLLVTCSPPSYFIINEERGSRLSRVLWSEPEPPYMQGIRDVLGFSIVGYGRPPT